VSLNSSSDAPESPNAPEIERLQAIARELAGLGPFETLQFTPAGRYFERRFKVPIDAGVIARTLAPFDPAHHRITGARFSPGEDLMLLHIVASDSPEPLPVESPTRAVKGNL
jgi:hypothetical protein